MDYLSCFCSDFLLFLHEKKDECLVIDMENKSFTLAKNTLNKKNKHEQIWTCHSFSFL